jgi:two-component system, chemotaxis family, CheB/CheR fusion protein
MITMKANMQKQAFPIIGVGGSAGSPEAFEEMLKAMPERPGIALVFIMHLAPDHKTMLPELLARVTKMPVLEITNGMTPVINHVYTKPPNTDLAMVRGKLVLSALKSESARGAMGVRAQGMFVEFGLYCSEIYQ